MTSRLIAVALDIALLCWLAHIVIRQMADREP